MFKFSKLICVLLLGTTAFFFTACNEDDTTPSGTKADMSIDVSLLPDLGDGHVYEGWLIVDGTPVSTGVFSIDDAGMASPAAFSVSETQLESATSFVVTIEPSPDNDAAPSKSKVLAGNFVGDECFLTIGHSDALGTDFTGATGKYIVATPTDNDGMLNEPSGVWFLDNTDNMLTAGLTLPVLPEGWAYEGWVVVDGTPLSTGTFTDPNGPDDSSIYSDTQASAPAFPGEDFLLNPPAGVSFPLSLSGKLVVISVEPSPDNSTDPFVLKPLVNTNMMNTQVHVPFDMTNNAIDSSPSGKVTR